MSASLHARDLRVTRGPAVVLDGVSMSLVPGRRVGIVGPNGVGKSTLLDALAGRIRLERGTVTTMPPDAAVGYLAQERERRPDETVAAFIERRTGVGAATVELDASTAALAAGEPGAGDRYADALERWMNLGGADLDSRVGEVFDRLGISAELVRRPTTVLSGGEAARVGLAALLLSRYDVYLLDEPTNDVDLEGLAILESWVVGLDAPVALVSHDRAFLERTVTDVVEVDEFTHRISSFAGGWRAFQEERERARRHAWERFEEYDAKRSNLAGRAQREREWATQGLSTARRKPADNDKNVKAFKINQTEQLAGKAARTEKAMERLDVIDKPREPWQLRLDIPMRERSGSVVARLHGAVIDRGDFRLGPVDLEVGFGERIAIAGSNGSGKTTLLNALLGRLQLSAGERWIGPGVVVGEMEQARRRLVSDRRFLDQFVGDTGMSVPDARTLLAKFGLVGDHVVRPAASLSPGERTRGTLAMLMAQGANCLVLDEPTNHLDLPAIEQLEQALETFAGTVLLVTHDRALLSHVRVTRVLTMVGGRLAADVAV